MKANTEVCKYQVFISSTYEDLKDVRADITLSILQMKNIPVGMEDFSASDDRGWEIITQTIDNSDFYVLIIAGKYGSVDKKTGKSWTEKEYDYATEKRLPVFVFIRENDNISKTLSEHGAKEENLKKFIKKVKDAHHCKTWKESIDLQKSVILALNDGKDTLGSSGKLLGWYRGNALIKKSVDQTIIRYSHIYLKVSGTREDCLKGKCKLVFYGSNVVVSPEKPIIFKDRYKTATKIDSFEFSKPPIILNLREFERNPRDLEFSIQSDIEDEALYFNGEVIFYIKISEKKGGFALHIPHFTEYITYIIDMSNIELIPASEPSAWLVKRDIKGVIKPENDSIEVKRYQEKKTWVISAYDVPADSNIELSWGY
jgi:hypothetical protein